MPSLSHKQGVYHVRFRLAGKQFKKSLKTSDAKAADAARHLVEVTLHRIYTGQLSVPPASTPATSS